MLRRLNFPSRFLRPSVAKFNSTFLTTASLVPSDLGSNPSFSIFPLKEDRQSISNLNKMTQEQNSKSGITDSVQAFFKAWDQSRSREFVNFTPPTVFSDYRQCIVMKRHEKEYRNIFAQIAHPNE